MYVCAGRSGGRALGPDLGGPWEDAAAAQCEAGVCSIPAGMSATGTRSVTLPRLTNVYSDIMQLDR